MISTKRVNPNRMELMRLKKKLSTAMRGHRLLKDKRDELMRQFLLVVKDQAVLRRRMEKALANANKAMVLARATLAPEVVLNALSSSKDPIEVEVKIENTMSVKTPVFEMYQDDESGSNKSTVLPYGMAGTSGELDVAIDSLNEALPIMLKLAQIEKKAQLMADEIEKTRRRVNSLEYVMIPELREQIHLITMKMDENERGNLTRLMKVKDMIVADQIAKSKMRDEAFA